MNREQRLIEKLATPENLLLAWRSVRGNIPKYRWERSVGPDGVSLAEFARDLDSQLNALQDMLLNNRYQPVQPARFYVPKKNGERREIAVLSIRDRVAQRAAQQVIEPLWEPEFFDCSFGFRPGLSIDDALACVQQFRKQGHRWVVDGDIATCFDHLDHDMLMARLNRKIKDRRVLCLLQKWLDAGVLQSGFPADPSEGTTNWLNHASTFFKRSSSWALENLARDTDPYAAARYETLHRYDSEMVDYPMNHEEVADNMRNKAFKRMALSGLVWGASWVKPAATRIRDTALISINTPAGRRLVTKGALTTGGLAGVAAAAAITTYLLKRKAGPAPTGVLQGSPLSPLLANIYLHPFDRMLLRKRHRLVRYADDWLILCPSYESAERAYNDAILSLAHINLKINHNKTKIRAPDEQFEWLGVVIR